MKIFVLNLPRATDRLRIMRERLADLGLEAEILPAVEGARIDRGSLPAGTEPGLSPGELGCYLSHVRFWETVVEQGLPAAIILEDDVLLDPALLEVAQGVLALGYPVDAVRLSALRPVRGITLGALPGGRRLVLPNKNPSGTQGYLVTQAGARRLLAALPVPRAPIDTTLDAYWKHDLYVPVVTPAVVEEDSTIASSIQGRFGSGKRKTLARHLAQVTEAQRRKLRVFLLARRLQRRSQAANQAK